MHEAILRRQPSIDQISDGLDSLGLLSLVRLLPDNFKGIFTYQPASLSSQLVISMLKFVNEEDFYKAPARAFLEVLKKATPDSKLCWTIVIDIT